LQCKLLQFLWDETIVCLHRDRIAQTQSQIGRDFHRHLVKACERGESFGNRVGVRERPHGIIKRREAGEVLRVRLQDRPDQDSANGQQVLGAADVVAARFLTRFAMTNLMTLTTSQLNRIIAIKEQIEGGRSWFHNQGVGFCPVDGREGIGSA